MSDGVADSSASALQQFLLMAKSVKGAGCAALISQALDHPSIYVFAELLDMMMDEANVSTHYRGSSVDVARAGEGSMLDHADQLKAWHTSLDDTEKFADICAMWTAGTADVVPDYRE